MRTFLVAAALALALGGTPARASKPDGHEALFGPMVALQCDGEAEAFALNDRGDAVGYCWSWPTLWMATREGSAPPSYLEAELVAYADGQPVAGELWFGSAYGINARGQIAVAIVVDGYYQPAIYQDGVHRMLPLAPGAIGGSLRGINDHGDVVGSSGGLPAFWRQGRFEELPSPWGNGGLAYSVNNAGEAVGTVYDDDGMWWPVLWRQLGSGDGEDGLAWEVVILDPDPGFARSISDSGHIVGTASPDFDGYTGYPLAWDVDGGRAVLAAFEGTAFGAANSVNSRGEIAGYAGINGVAPIPAGVYWPEADAYPVGLGTTATDGTGFSFARAINGRGDVAGTSGNSYSDGLPQAFIVRRLRQVGR